jgi:hypothetical protein
MSQRRAYNQTITIERNTPSKDAMGGRTDSFASLSGSIKALGYKHSEKPQHIAESFSRPDWKGDFVWQTLTDCGARPGDRVNHGSVYYTIHAAFPYSNPFSGRSVYVMDCSLIRAGSGTT